MIFVSQTQSPLCAINKAEFEIVYIHINCLHKMHTKIKHTKILHYYYYTIINILQYTKKHRSAQAPNPQIFKKYYA
jgi:hypothetical protein